MEMNQKFKESQEPLPNAKFYFLEVQNDLLRVFHRTSHR